MTNLATSEVNAAVESAAAHLVQAAGPDGIVSRQDIRSKLYSLKGTERELVEALYHFISDRETKRTARMTRRDIDSAVAAIRTDIIENIDLDKNGLSEDEVARMSKLGKLAVTLALMLKAKVSGPTGQELAQEIGELAKGVFFDSYYSTEGATPLEPFFAAAKLTHLTLNDFRATLQLTNGPEHEAKEDFGPGEYTLAAIRRANDSEEGENKAAKLIEFLEIHLREIQEVVIGRDAGQDRTWPVHAYVVGLDAKGNIVGVRAELIWT